MSYRRAVLSDESIPLPIETVYNSVVDSLKVRGKYGVKYMTNGDNHFNRLYFKYPPEWHTSDLGEKIIGIRNMSIKWRDGELDFVLYIRKYDLAAFLDVNTSFQEHNFEIYNKLTREEINQIVIDNLDSNQVKVYPIPIHIKVSFNNNWIDIKDQIRKAIDEKNLYKHIRDRIFNRLILADQREALLNRLEQIKDDYKTMLQESNELIGEDIPFYLQSSDVDIIDTFEDDEHVLKFTSKLNKGDDGEYGIGFCIMKPNDSYDEDNVDYIYNKLYDGPYSPNRDKHKLSDEGKLPEEFEEEEEEFETKITDDDRFDQYTANFFNMDNNNPYKNELTYMYQYHDEFIIRNMMTNLQCEVATSFASQSNHNIIGRTNENFTPIKYYKLLDKDDTFWIEFYDRDEIKIPIAINDNAVFTMDVVFLQNRKLLYS